MDEAIAAQATAGPQEQVHAYEILLQLGDETQDPTAGGPQVRASHILYSPNDDSQAAAALPSADPAWTVAEAEATTAAEQLRAIADGEARAEQFATRAQNESDDTGSGSRGGDLDWFSQSAMVEPFANAVFEGEHAENEIIGPVRSEFGYHVILFVGRRPPILERVAQIKEALAKPDANFEALAREHSDATSADEGGEIGWVARLQEEKEIEDALFALQAGQMTTEPIEREDGYHFYLVKERKQREISNEQRNTLEQLAFQNWYQPQRDAAQTDGTIFVDPSVGSLQTQ
jgi:parvulin-like peptidyl-prolyl isomerase